MISVYEVMKHCRNFFADEDNIKYGNWNVENGQLSLPFLTSGQYFIIEGSKLNDNRVHINTTGYLDLEDENFNGYIIPCLVPASFIDICNKIAAYVAKNEDSGNALTSESFGGYSYTKATNSSGMAAGAFDAFREELNVWRKI